MKKLSVLAMSVLFVGLMMGGCAPYHSEVKITKKFFGEAIQQKNINVAIAATDEVKMSAEATASLREKVEEEIKKQGWVIKNTDLIVEIGITKYQEGSAFGRFLAGATLSSAVAAIIEGGIRVSKKGMPVLETEIIARTSYIGWSSRSIEGVQEKFAKEVANILEQIKK